MCELQLGELQQYNVIRVSDEIRVGLMVSAGGINYSEAVKHVMAQELGGVPIPFASPRLRWRMKAVTHRKKDAGDLFFLRQWFVERGEEPPKAWQVISLRVAASSILLPSGGCLQWCRSETSGRDAAGRTAGFARAPGARGLSRNISQRARPPRARNIFDRAESSL